MSGLQARTETWLVHCIVHEEQLHNRAKIGLQREPSVAVMVLVYLTRPETPVAEPRAPMCGFCWMRGRGMLWLETMLCLSREQTRKLQQA